MTERNALLMDRKGQTNPWLQTHGPRKVTVTEDSKGRPGGWKPGPRRAKKAPRSLLLIDPIFPSLSRTRAERVAHPPCPCCR